MDGGPRTGAPLSVDVPQPPIITLTTDFGSADPYVASMKAVILSLNRQAVIVDVSHSVRPQQVGQGAFLLEAARPYFPPGSIHIAVVDPGVGSERRAIALATGSATFVGPDNGVLSAALPDEARPTLDDGVGRVSLPAAVTGVALTDPRYHRRPVSDTFHGRDIFAPAAAHLSLGVQLSELGRALDEVFALPPFRARRQADGSLAGHVVHIDAFGNLITDVRAEDVPSTGAVVEIRGHRIEGVQRTYASRSGLGVLVGSLGFLEIALTGGSAAAKLKADIGETVAVRA